MTGEFEIRLSKANSSRSLTLQVVVDDVHVVNAEEFRGSEGGGKGDYCALFKLVASGALALELPVLDIGSWGWWTKRGLIKIVRSPLAKGRARTRRTCSSVKTGGEWRSHQTNSRCSTCCMMHMLQSRMDSERHAEGSSVCSCYFQDH